MVSNGSDSMGECLRQPQVKLFENVTEGPGQGGAQTASDIAMASPQAQALFGTCVTTPHNPSTGSLDSERVPRKANSPAAKEWPSSPGTGSWQDKYPLVREVRGSSLPKAPADPSLLHKLADLQAQAGCHLEN